MTARGLAFLCQTGASEAEIRAHTDIIPSLQRVDRIRFGAGFSLTENGKTIMCVLVGDYEPVFTWLQIGLTPVSVTSALGRDLINRSVGERVMDEYRRQYFVASIFAPDITGATIYEPPEQIRCIA